MKGLLSTITFSSIFLWASLSNLTLSEAQRVKSSKVNCTDAFAKVEKCSIGTVYSFIHPGYEHPTNEKEVSGRCVKSIESLACYRQYAKCFDPLIRESVLSFVRGRNTRINPFCKNPTSESSRFTLEGFKCLRDHKAKQGAQFESNLLKRLDAVSKNNLTFGERVQVACCTILEFKENFDKVIAPQCDKYASVVEDDIMSYIGELFPLLCVKYGDHKLRPNKECLTAPKLVFTDKVDSKTLGSAIVAIAATIGRQ